MHLCEYIYNIEHLKVSFVTLPSRIQTSVGWSSRSHLMGLGFEVLAPPGGSYSGFGSQCLSLACRRTGPSSRVSHTVVGSELSREFCTCIGPSLFTTDTFLGLGEGLRTRFHVKMWILIVKIIFCKYSYINLSTHNLVQIYTDNDIHRCYLYHRTKSTQETLWNSG